MRIYISGPMTGYPDSNFPAFREAAQLLRRRGYVVYSPAENFGGVTSHSRKECMRLDILHVLQCDAVCVLPGWEQSAGARLEVAVAIEAGLDIYTIEDGAVVTPIKPSVRTEVVHVQ